MRNLLRAGRAVVAAMCAGCIGLSLGGCNRGPDRIDAPSWDPPALAGRIIGELDTSRDDCLDAVELKAAPGLAAGARHIDKDKDNRLSRGEIENRFERYQERQIGLRPQEFRFIYKGRPLAGAEIAFLPEPFLDDLIASAMGTTDAQGIVIPQVEGEELLGMRIGYYRVRIKSPHVAIPAKYSGDSALGVEVSGMSDDLSSYGTTVVRLAD